MKTFLRSFRRASLPLTLGMLAAAAHANQIAWVSLDVPAAAIGGSVLQITAVVTNTGGEAWGDWHNLVMKDARGIPVAMESLDGVAPGQTVTCRIAYGLPDDAAVYSFQFQALEHNVEYFGDTQYRTVTVSAKPPYLGMQLATTTFSRSAPPNISTTDPILDWPFYRLRAKVIDGTQYGWHAANAWSRNNYPLDNPPPAGNYAICSLYWVRYNSIWGSIVYPIGPERFVSLAVDSVVELSRYWFHAGNPPAITLQGAGQDGADYRLFATLTNGQGGTWETTWRKNNNGDMLVKLPPPGAYQAALSWQKYDAAGNMVGSKPPRIVPVTIVEGPQLLFVFGGTINSEEYVDEEWGTTVASYSTDTYWFDVPSAGTLEIAVSGLSGGAYGQVYGPSYQLLYSGEFPVTLTVTPGSGYQVTISANEAAMYCLSGAFTPAAVAPVITSASSASGTVGAVFGGYAVTAVGPGTITYGATGLPPGLALSPAWGIITGTPTAAGTYSAWITATNSGGTAGKWVTFTVSGLPAPIAFAAKDVAPTEFLLTWSAVFGATQYRLDLATDANFSRVILYDFPVTYSANGLTTTGISYRVRNSASTPIIAGGTYYYRVRAISGSNSSSYSALMSVTLPRFSTAAGSEAQPLLFDVPESLKVAGTWTPFPDNVPDKITPLGEAGGSSIRILDMGCSTVTVTFSGDVNDWFGLRTTLADLDGNGVPDGGPYAPSVVWESDTTFTQYLGSTFWVEIEFQAEAGRKYEIYTSANPVISAANLKLWDGPLVYDCSGLQTLISPNMLASDFKDRAFYLVEHTFAPAGVQITLPVIGDVVLRKGANGAVGAITVLGDLSIGVSATEVTVAKPGIGTVVVRNGTISGSLNLGGGNVVSASGNGVTLILSGGVVISATTGGIQMTIPGGISAAVGSNGAIALTLPAGASMGMKNVVDQLGSVLGLCVPGGPGAVAQVIAAGGTPSSGGWGTADQILLGSRPAGDYDVWVKENNCPDATAVLIRLAVLPSAVGGIAGPTLMWINDDNDSGDFGSEDVPGNSSPNCADSMTNGVRDLVDFFPVFLNLREYAQAFAPGSGVKYKLKQGDGAVNFVYTNLTASSAQSIHRQVFSTGFGDDFNQPAGAAQVHGVTATGVELSASFLSRIANGTGNVILIEGCRQSSRPLVLSIERSDGSNIATFEMPLRISAVESMFRHVDLSQVNQEYEGTPISPSVAAQLSRFGDPGDPYPDGCTNGKYFVFVHGYDVNGQEARGWHCEIFKRLYQLGSRARFVGVTWNGSTGLDYHKAVFHSFQTGGDLGVHLNWAGVTGDVTIAAHSLGNMLVSHAIASGGFTPTRYFMINGAVPAEAYNSGGIDDDQRKAMIEDDWRDRKARFFAADWHQLFKEDPTDARNTLTWKDRFSRVREQTAVHNFFSPGEDVVAKPETASASAVATVFRQGFNLKRGVWTAQELVKGVSWYMSLAELFMKRGQAGWNARLSVYGFSPGSEVSDEQLKTEPYFERFREEELMHSDPAIASAKAAVPKVKYDLLARGIPALSYAAAVAPVLGLAEGRNYDMEVNGRSLGIWPSEGHSGRDVNRWLHSDFRNVALPLVSSMYLKMIEIGGL